MKKFFIEIKGFIKWFIKINRQIALGPSYTKHETYKKLNKLFKK